MLEPCFAGIPGFVSFFSDVPGPSDEVLAEIGNYGFCAHHLGTEDVGEDALVVVEVDGQQLSLWIERHKKVTQQGGWRGEEGEQDRGMSGLATASSRDANARSGLNLSLGEDFRRVDSGLFYICGRKAAFRG